MKISRVLGGSKKVRKCTFVLCCECHERFIFMAMKLVFWNFLDYLASNHATSRYARLSKT